MVQPIWQVLADLGVEGEYCQRAVDAVEKVTTQSFQIVITDWDDQPEAGFLLKTARELKAAHRPLTLAIVSDEGRLPEALRAGANSVLVKPIRPEQVRDTMSTACQLLRVKQHAGAPAIPANEAAQQTAALAAAASTGSVSTPAPVSAPPSVTQAPEKIRAGEFLQSAAPAPGAQFDTDSELDVPEESAAEEVEALTELEPTAASVASSPAPEPAPEKPVTGWAMLQARLTKTAPSKPEDAAAENELLSYGDTPSHRAPATAPQEDKSDGANEPQPEIESDAALLDYMSGDAPATAERTPQDQPSRGKFFLVATLAAGCVVAITVPRTRQSLQSLYHTSARAASRWLNPPPAPLPPAVTLHDSFGQAGDEYKLPAPGNIPDATTDPSQIRVLPVVDPTAKTDKPSDANGQAPNSVTETPADQNQSVAGQDGAIQVQEKDPGTSGVADVPQNQTATVPAQPPSVQVPAQTNPPVVQAPLPQPQVTLPARIPAPPPSRSPSAGTNAGIPSSLKSQVAPSIPESSGAKPAEAAMSSIEPMKLSEAAVRELLDQPVEPEYPAAAKATSQRGSVILQVLIDRDGTVQQAKFLQGSLVFARPAIDAVRQWHFKPYTMNGRAVSVQSVVTLSFKPPA